MKFTFHTFISFFPGVFAGVVLALMHTYPRIPVFFAGFAVWWVFIILFHFFFKLQHKHLFLQLATSFAFIALLGLVEWKPLVWFLVILAVIMFSFIWRWVTEVSRHSSGIMYKTWRRIIMMIWVFDVYAGVTALFALPIFFQGLPHIVMVCIAGVFTAGVSAIMWHVYFHIDIKMFALWASIITLVVAELMWALFYLPLGYFGLGLLLTWIWYVVQLFIRFHLTKGGIIWQKQKTFLLINAVVFSSVLFLLRFV